MGRLSRVARSKSGRLDPRGGPRELERVEQGHGHRRPGRVEQQDAAAHEDRGVREGRSGPSHAPHHTRSHPRDRPDLAGRVLPCARVLPRAERAGASVRPRKPGRDGLAHEAGPDPDDAARQRHQPERGGRPTASAASPIAGGPTRNPLYPVVATAARPTPAGVPASGPRRRTAPGPRWRARAPPGWLPRWRPPRGP